MSGFVFPVMLARAYYIKGSDMTQNPVPLSKLFSAEVDGPMPSTQHLSFLLSQDEFSRSFTGTGRALTVRRFGNCAPGNVAIGGHVCLSEYHNGHPTGHEVAAQVQNFWVREENGGTYTYVQVEHPQSRDRIYRAPLYTPPDDRGVNAPDDLRLAA
jgi:hypothetical protein